MQKIFSRGKWNKCYLFTTWYYNARNILYKNVCTFLCLLAGHVRPIVHKTANTTTPEYVFAKMMQRTNNSIPRGTSTSFSLPFFSVSVSLLRTRTSLARFSLLRKLPSPHPLSPSLEREKHTRGTHASEREERERESERRVESLEAVRPLRSRSIFPARIPSPPRAYTCHREREGGRDGVGQHVFLTRVLLGWVQSQGEWWMDCLLILVWEWGWLELFLGGWL